MRSNAVLGGVLYFKLGVGRCSYDASTMLLLKKAFALCVGISLSAFGHASIYVLFMSAR
jgi:hypothetical protein